MTKEFNTKKETENNVAKITNDMIDNLAQNFKNNTYKFSAHEATLILKKMQKLTKQMEKITSDAQSKWALERPPVLY